MTAALSPTPKLQFFDANGNPLVGGKVYSYAAGTTTPLATYTDATGTTPAANPIILNGRGETSLWLGDAAYKLKLTTAADVEVWTVDNVEQGAAGLPYTPAGTSLLNGVVTTAGDALNAITNASTGSQYVGFLQAGLGAVTRTAQAKMRDIVSVKDFGAVGDGVADDTVAVLNALAYVKSIDGSLYFPAGNYLVQSAMYLDRGITVYGDGLIATTITRTSLSPTVINGNNIYAVFYVEGGWNHIRDLQISGAGNTTSTVSGIQFGVNIAAKGSIKNVAINNMLNGITETDGVFLYEFNNIQAVSCENGFNFNSSNQKTSLTFNQCYAANTGPAYVMKLVNYSVMNSCAADNCNWGSTPGNPYGIGYGDPASSRGVYYFEQSDVVLNSIGSEGSYGNGVVSMDSSFITINSMFSYDCRSLFVPNYTAYPNYAVGPIQCSTSGNRLTVNNAFNRLWSNTAVSTGHPTKPIASLVAFNYDEAVLGVIQGNQVTVSVSDLRASSNVFAGMGPIGRNCVNIAAATKAPAFGVNTSGNTVLSPSVWTKVAFDTAEYDSNGVYSTANNRFQPNVAGYYTFNCTLHFRNTAGGAISDAAASLYKNGSSARDFMSFNAPGSDYRDSVATSIYLNGTTDYAEIYAIALGANVVVGVLPAWTNWQGNLARTA